MNIHKNISLQAYNTFGIEQKAALLIEAYDTKISLRHCALIRT